MCPALTFPYVLTEGGQVSLKGYHLRSQPVGAPLVVTGIFPGFVMGQALDICCGGWNREEVSS
ncbi:MAG: hypothetical protein J7L86_00320 [Candidatus Marinimicrobia bacterium]|nr:hypothetical protein [Candidatus Neomarinimicrobiota bacterium]